MNYRAYIRRETRAKRNKLLLSFFRSGFSIAFGWVISISPMVPAVLTGALVTQDLQGIFFFFKTKKLKLSDLGLVTDSDYVELVCVALATTGCRSRNSVEPSWFYTSSFLLCTNTSSLELRERLVIASWVFCQELNNCIQILLMKLLTYFRQRNNHRTLSHPKWTWDFVWTWDVQICVSFWCCWVGRATDSFLCSGHRWENSRIQVRNLHSHVG